MYKESNFKLVLFNITHVWIPYHRVFELCDQQFRLAAMKPSKKNSVSDEWPAIFALYYVDETSLKWKVGGRRWCSLSVESTLNSFNQEWQVVSLVLFCWMLSGSLLICSFCRSQSPLLIATLEIDLLLAWLCAIQSFCTRQNQYHHSRMQHIWKIAHSGNELMISYVCWFGVLLDLHSDSVLKESAFSWESRKPALHLCNHNPLAWLKGWNEHQKLKFVDYHHRDWDYYIPYLMMALHSTSRETTKCTPAMLQFGHELRLPIELLHNCSYSQV